MGRAVVYREHEVYCELLLYLLCDASQIAYRLGQQRKLKTRKMSAVPIDPEHTEPVAIFNYIYRPRGETLPLTLSILQII